MLMSVLYFTIKVLNEYNDYDIFTPIRARNKLWNCSKYFRNCLLIWSF